MALSATGLNYPVLKQVTGNITFDSSYPTGGESLSAAAIGLAQFDTLQIITEAGYFFETNVAADRLTCTIKVYQGGEGGFTPAGTNSTSAVTGTAAAQTFTGTPMGNHQHVQQTTFDEVVSVTAGTGVSAALVNTPIAMVENVFVTAGGVTGVFQLVPVGAVTATTQVSINHTTGVMQFLVADAVTSATVSYLRSNTSGESAGTPAGTNAASATLTATAAAQVFTGTAAPAGTADEVANGTDLSAVTARFVAWGY